MPFRFFNTSTSKDKSSFSYFKYAFGEVFLVAIGILIALHAKHELEDYNGAIVDYNKAIELDPNDGVSYNNKGLTKYQLEDYYGAILDFTKAIELNPNDVVSYNNRAYTREMVGDLNGACLDFKKAADMGDSDAAKMVAKQCN